MYQWNPTAYKKDHNHNQVGFTPGSQDGSTYTNQSMSYIILSKQKRKKHMIISIDVKKGFDKVQYPFIIKTLTKMGSEGT